VQKNVCLRYREGFFFHLAGEKHQPMPETFLQQLQLQIRPTFGPPEKYGIKQ